MTPERIKLRRSRSCATEREHCLKGLSRHSPTPSQDHHPPTIQRSTTETSQVYTGAEKNKSRCSRAVFVRCAVVIVIRALKRVTVTTRTNGEIFNRSEIHLLSQSSLAHALPCSCLYRLAKQTKSPGRRCTEGNYTVWMTNHQREEPDTWRIFTKKGYPGNPF